MRLNWFSPLAPQRTAIAQYTVHIAPMLMERFDVVFWSDLEADAQHLPDGARLKAFDPADIHRGEFNRELFRGLNIYNIGNNARFHAGIAQIALQTPGLAVLHDTRLHHFAFGRARHETPPFGSYLDQAEAIYGSAGLATASGIIDVHGQTIDEHVDAMPFVEPFLEASLGAICHSRFAHAQVRARSDAPVLTLPLPFASRAKPGGVPRAGAPPWRFVMFGYVGSNRRLEGILQALASWPQAPPFQFDIYGSLWDPALINSLIERSGLADRVKVHGFVSDAVLDDAIAQAHLAFNLRSPTMGEASEGILHSWAYATPALVTDEGWYRELPAQVAWKVSADNEIADLHQALNTLIQSPQTFAQMGLAAQGRLLDVHAPDRYVDALARALGDLPALTTRFAARRTLQRAAFNIRSQPERRILLARACPNIVGMFERAIPLATSKPDRPTTRAIHD